jgi:CBS domain-containing protein
LNDRFPLTVVTDRDLLLALCQRGVAADQLRIADLGGRQPITCAPDLPLAEAAARMRRNRVRRLLVVDEYQRLLGVLALADLARACVDDHSLSRAELAAVLEGLCR